MASRATLEWVTCWRDSTRSRYPPKLVAGSLITRAFHRSVMSFPRRRIQE